MPLTHLDAQGQASMVDVGSKDATVRSARARAEVEMPATVMAAVQNRNMPKGDAFAAARIAGIQAAKKTPDLIPLCHPVALSSVAVDFEVDAAQRTIGIVCRARSRGRTGVEMEALTGVSVAALTLYDMLKGLDKGIRIRDVRLLAKEGGKSGAWRAADADAGQP